MSEDLPGMVFTYEEVDLIRNRDLRLIGELMETERNLVEQLGRATVRAEQWEDACKKLEDRGGSALEALRRVDHTLTAHGHIDDGTDLAAFVRAALAKAAS